MKSGRALFPVTALVTVLVLWGCGVKGPPHPPTLPRLAPLGGVDGGSP